MKSKLIKIAAVAVAACALVVMLAACGGGATLSQKVLDEVSGVSVEAQNAGTNESATTAGAITVKEGDVIIVSPDLKEGSFHLKIASPDGALVPYDDVATGRVEFPVEAEPGSYDVTTSGNGGTTGTMTVFAKNKAEYDAENAALDEAVQEAAAQQEAAQ